MYRRGRQAVGIRFIFFALVVWAVSGCNTTRHLKPGEYLLQKNTVKLETDKGLTRKGEFRDNIERLIIQKPNTRFLGLPYKLWLYNLRYAKHELDTELPKTLERPVLFDSVSMRRSADNVRGYLFNQGYFYPRVTDTVVYRDQKAYARYNVQTGINFLIHKIFTDIDDNAASSIIRSSMDATVLKEGIPFTNSLLELERSRITKLLKEFGYYKFSQENIYFELDTMNKAFLRDIDNPFESAINFLALQKKQKKPTLDIKIIIRSDNPDAYRKYRINRITVYPDYVGREDARDSTMIRRQAGDILFRYHNYYIKENVIAKHVYLEHDKLYSQSDYEATLNRLNDLGVFQSIRIVLVDDTTARNEETGRLNAYVLLSPARKYDFTTNLELSTSSIYFFGITPTVSFRNQNLGKGANLATTALSAGIETIYDKNSGDNFFKHISLLTKSYGINTSIDFPKFLVPFRINYSKQNLPRSVISLGYNLLDRVNYFTLTNTSANLSYNWKETPTHTWGITPSFVSIIRLPAVSDSFTRRLENNDFLKNSYRETFIEGENVSFTFSTQTARKGQSYTYLRLGLEEAGGLMKGLDQLGALGNFIYSQYVKLDFDLRRYINYGGSQIATRFYGGVGVPYGASTTLPYTKQYYVGGAYSIRGWRIRSLGPGSFFDSTAQAGNTFIDRTGDIKLEMNGEYRFDMLQLFTGVVKMRGALFADAGNIWLYNTSTNYPGGEFAFNKLGRDIALSAGAGVRFDFSSFFILRFDLAMPLKKPYTPDNGGWVLRDIAFGSRDWRNNNLVLNIAIGYPF